MRDERNPDRFLSWSEVDKVLVDLLMTIGLEIGELKELGGKTQEQFDDEFAEELVAFENLKYRAAQVKEKSGISLKDLDTLGSDAERLLIKMKNKAIEYGYKPTPDSGTTEKPN